MKSFIYFLTDKNRSIIHIDQSSDLVKTVNVIHEAKDLFFELIAQPNRLVYFEEYSNDALMHERQKQLKRFTKTQKEKLIRSVNPDWIDLSTGLRHEKVLQTKMFSTKVPLSFSRN